MMTTPGDPSNPRLVPLGNTLDDAIRQLTTWFDQIPAATYLLRPDPENIDALQTIHVSPEIESIAGYPPDAWWQPDFWTTHVHPDDRAVALALQQQLRHKDRIEHEYRFRHRDGHDIWIHDRLSAQRDETGAIRLILGIYRDVSAHRNAEWLLTAHHDLLLALQRIAADPEAAMRAVLDSALGLPGIDCGGIYDVDPQNGYLTLIVHGGFSSKYVAATYTLSGDIGLGAIAHAGQPRYSFRDPAPRDLPSAIREEGLRAITILPILDGKQVIACLKLASHQADTIPDLSCRMSETLALQLGEVLSRIRGETAAATERRHLLALLKAQQEAKETIHRLYQAIEQIPISIVLTDLQARIEYVNPYFTQATGYSQEEALGQNPRLLKSGETPPDHYRRLWQTLADGGIWTGEFHNRRKDGSLYWERAIISPVRNLDERITHFLSIKEDITAQRQAEQQLRLAASVFKHAYEGILITDANACIVEVNDTFSVLTGYDREEALGRNPRFLQSGRHDPEFFVALWRALLEEGFWTGELWNRKKNGEIYAEIASIAAVRDDTGRVTHYVNVFADITALKDSQRRLENLAYHDPLTQLPNRALLADRLQQAIAHAKRQRTLLAVCYLDLDGFKQINDTLGHAVGDRLLIAVAERLRTCMRCSDTVARLGGDEFVVLFGGLSDMGECECAVIRLLSTLATPHVLGEHSLAVTASIGVALHPLDGDDADTLLRHADQAMYLAKQAGHNRYWLFGAERCSR